jgi:hypothetical protein
MTGFRSVGTWSKRTGVVVGIAAAGLLGATLAWATIPASNGVIHACYNSTSGALRVIDTGAGQSCTASEKPLQWSAQILKYRGAWSSSTPYLANDVVVYLGSSYLALAANTNKAPATNPGSWGVLAHKGNTGTPGPPGPSGVVSTSSSCFSGSTLPCDTADYAWIGGSPVSVTLASNQAVQVNGSVTTFAFAGSALKAALGICAAPSGTTTGMTAVGGGFDFQIPANPSSYGAQASSLTRVVKASDLGGAGTYSVGNCYSPSHTSGSTDEANITTVVFNVGS